MRPKSARKPAPSPAAHVRPAPLAQVVTHECARCGELHNGTRPPAFWAVHPKLGLICGSCDDRVALAEITGTPVERRAA